MKPAAALVLLALANVAGACQGINHDAGLALSRTVAGEAAFATDEADEERAANLDDFYREKLGIDPHILYAHRDASATLTPGATAGSASGN